MDFFGVLDVLRGEKERCRGDESMDGPRKEDSVVLRSTLVIKPVIYTQTAIWAGVMKVETIESTVIT